MDGTGAITVVLIEDHRMFAESIGRVLALEPGIDVVGLASDAAGGVDVVAEQQPAIVLLDDQLPDGAAPEVAPRLRACSPQTRIVVLSGTGSEQTMVAALAAGCHGYVTKAQPIDDLVVAVRRVHAGEAHVPSSMVAALLPRIRGDSARSVALTSREREVLACLSAGMGSAAIAARLYLSIHTVRNHVQRASGKLGAHSKLEAVAIARREGLI